MTLLNNNIKSFISANKLVQANYYSANLKDKSWYILVQGNYGDLSSAKAAIAALPENIRNLKPYPRKISSVQKDINKAQES